MLDFTGIIGVGRIKLFDQLDLLAAAVVVETFNHSNVSHFGGIWNER